MATGKAPKKPLFKLFKKKQSKPVADSPTSTLEKLYELEERLLKKQEFLLHKCELELQTVKANARTNKPVALRALRRKKQYEKQLTQIDGTLSTVEFQREALDSAAANSHVLTVMSEAAKALKGATNIDVDQVHDIIDDIAEQREVAEEISEAISSAGRQSGYDDAELLAELESLERDNNYLAEGFENLDLSDELPDVPVADPRGHFAASQSPPPRIKAATKLSVAKSTAV